MQFANIQWQESLNCTATPYSLDFNDVYFNSDDGLAETQYVFINKNDLIKRFNNLKEPVFTIFETGFGTGLNFYAVADCWLKHAPKTASLHFISVEKLPLALADMQRASQLWPQFYAISNDLIAQYQQLKLHRNVFSMPASRIQLALWVDDVNEVLPNIRITDDLWVDAFLLDGFAPVKNPDMWHKETLNHMARIATGGSTFATFTSASLVQRNLKAAGFCVNKYAGFGKKREMLAGYFNGH